MKEYDCCPICLSKNINVKYKGVFAHDSQDKYDIFECDNCKVQFVKQILTNEEIKKYYSKIKKTTDHTYADENIENLNYYYFKLKDKIEKLCPKKGKILDIGCSSGYFLDVMDGWECFGVEISTKYAKIAQEKYGCNIFEGSIEDYENQEEFFDVITMQDSFDHMLNPLKVIQKCKKLLKHKGFLVIKAHNVNCLYAKLSGSNFYAFVPPEHLFYYDKDSISYILNNNDFKMLSFGFIPHQFQMKTIFLRLSRDISTHPLYKIYEKIRNIWLGNVKFKKDLHDIFTVFAQKN